MLTNIDRVQLVVEDRKAAAEGWKTLLGAEHVRDDKVACLGALRSVYQVGSSEVELLEADGTGPVEASLTARGRPHLFGAGVATPDLDALVAHIEKTSAALTKEGKHAYVTFREAGQNDLRFVVSERVERAPVGLIDRLYEATILEGSYQPLIDSVTKLFGLNADHYSRITSDHFKYDGYLTLFHPDELDRFEIITPTSPETTMGRFHGRQGRAFYMSFAETPHILKIEERAKEAGAGLTVDRPEGRAETEMADQMWLHPPALGGMMLGISRPSRAWNWSGRPDRVIEL
jgi:hypothetical protein